MKTNLDPKALGLRLVFKAVQLQNQNEAGRLAFISDPSPYRSKPPTDNFMNSFWLI